MVCSVSVGIIKETREHLQVPHNDRKHTYTHPLVCVYTHTRARARTHARIHTYTHFVRVSCSFTRWLAGIVGDWDLTSTITLEATVRFITLLCFFFSPASSIDLRVGVTQSLWPIFFFCFFFFFFFRSFSFFFFCFFFFSRPQLTLCNAVNRTLKSSY